MRYLIGMVRVVLLVVILAAATALILVLALVPVRVRGAKLCAWPATMPFCSSRWPPCGSWARARSAPGRSSAGLRPQSTPSM
jgi:hypothetical protein